MGIIKYFYKKKEEFKKIKMLKFLALICLCLAVQINAETKHDSHYLQHGVGYHGYLYPYHDYYYAWYNTWPTYFSPATVHAPACDVCPSSCGGTCGLWSGLYACQYTHCPAVGNPCTAYNCARGNYLHPHPFHSHRYIQCDITPGRQFIRTCPSGLVFDPRFSVCNYPTGVVHYYNHYASHWLYGK